jgi:hypothetical protein
MAKSINSMAKVLFKHLQKSARNELTIFLCLELILNKNNCNQVKAPVLKPH